MLADHADLVGDEVGAVEADAEPRRWVESQEHKKKKPLASSGSGTPDGCFHNWGVLCVGVLVMRALLFGVGKPRSRQEDSMRTWVASGTRAGCF